jgi:HK97 family phage portal protein
MFNTITNAFNLNITLGNELELSQAATIRAIMEGGQYSSQMIDNVTFTCKKILCETLSKLPLNVTKDNKKFSEHKLFNLIHNNPNSYTTTNNFINKIVSDLVDYGNCFYKINKQNGVVQNLQYLKVSDFVKVELNENGILIYHFKNNLKIDSDNILHFKYFILNEDGLLAVSPKEVLYKQLSIYFQANNIINNYYKNGLHSNKVMKSQNNVDQRGFSQGQNEFLKQKTGSVEAGKIIPLPFGTEIQELKMDFTDAHLLPTLEYIIKQVAAMFGIPLFMVGVGEMKYKNIEESLIAFQTQTIAPLAKIFKEEMSSKLLFNEKERIKENIAIEFNLQAMLAANSITRATYLKLLKDASIISPNDAAKIEGFEEFEGGQYNYSQAQNQPLQLITKDGWNPITNGTTNNKKDE